MEMPLLAELQRMPGMVLLHQEGMEPREQPRPSTETSARTKEQTNAAPPIKKMVIYSILQQQNTSYSTSMGC